ncbi:MAG: adenosine kinase [Sphingobium sp. 66-54]|nr:MAG: adenosine kinase [Sphingobium sp. 66-54]
MSEAIHDVLGVGNAIVDIIAQADDAFLEAHGMAKGGMALIDEARAHALYATMGSAIEASGGSAANTIAGVASFGGRAAFIGKVRDDEFGQIFGHDLTSLGVRFTTPAATNGAATARCLVLVTPDAQRTMNTHLGACVDLTPADIDADLVAASAITYLEGYLFDPPAAKDAFRKAATIARGAGRKVALTLSDSFCVHRYKDEFKQLIAEHIDILFANEAEIEALYGSRDIAAAADDLAGQVSIAAITRSEKGSLLVSGSERVAVPAAPIEELVDTTGAGDLYAAGVLYGLSRQLSLAECGRLGSLAAAEVIQHYGARPLQPLGELA